MPSRKSFVSRITFAFGGATPNSAQSLLLVLSSGITPDVLASAAHILTLE